MKNLLLIALVLFGTTTFAADTNEKTVGEISTECKSQVQNNRNGVESGSESDGASEEEKSSSADRV